MTIRLRPPAKPARDYAPMSVSVSLPAELQTGFLDPAFNGPTQPDHSPGLADAFRPPVPAAKLIPDDWDLELSPLPVAVAPPPLATEQALRETAARDR